MRKRMECDERQLNKHYSALTSGARGCSAKLMNTWPKARAIRRVVGAVVIVVLPEVQSSGMVTLS